MGTYDHQTKAGNAGDVVKHPALIAVLEGLLAEHEGPFRYADAFAGRWESILLEGAGWADGIGAFIARWHGANPDVQSWHRQWRTAAGARYPGSTQLAERLLAKHGRYQIRAFEIVDAYAASLREGLGEAAVFTRPATPSDWTDWRPDLLFIDPPGLRSARRPDDPLLEDLLDLAEGLPNVLLWLPLAKPPDAVLEGCVCSALQALNVRWSEDDPMPGCRLLYRFASERVRRRLIAAVEAVARTMGWEWQRR